MGGRVIEIPARARPSLTALLLLLPLLGACGEGSPEAGFGAGTEHRRFAGRAACTSCHSHIAESFGGTGMGRSFYALTPASAVEDFQEENRLELPGDGLVYTMERRDGSFWMRQDVVDARGSVLASLEKEMVWVVGSGNHARSYLTDDEGLLHQMPVCWYPGKPGWDLCPGYERNNAYFNRRVGDACLSCHNAWMAADPQRPGRYVHPFPEGIDCERCHGPGAAHAAILRDREAGPAEARGTIVNPGELDAARRMDVCAQCHMGGAEATERILRRGRDRFAFTPGEDLAAHIQVVGVFPPSRSRFGLGSQVERLMLSRCYQDSGGELDCLTCHNPHVSVYDEAAPGAGIRQACLGCHGMDGCALGPQERAGRDCAGCHMRRAEPADQRFTRFTDHWIRRDIGDGESEPERGPLDVVALLDRWSGGSSAAERSLLLGTGAYFLKMRDPETAGRIPWSVAEGHLTRAVALDPDLSPAWNLLGEIALKKGHPSRALGSFREAASRDPESFAAALNLGTLLLDRGRPSEALEVLEAAARLEAPGVTARTQKARALVALGRESEARTLLDRLLAEAPGDPGVLANAGLLAVRQGRHGEAVDLLRRAGAADPGEPAVWSALASSLLALGRPGEAVGPARRAARLAPPAGRSGGGGAGAHPVPQAQPGPGPGSPPAD